MPAKDPVSLTWQTIFCFIPIIDIVASYRMKRLRWYLLIFIVFGAILAGAQIVVNPLDETSVYNDKIFSEETGFDWNYAILGSNPGPTILTIIIHNGIAYGIAVYLIRRWSKKWNLQFT